MSAAPSLRARLRRGHVTVVAVVAVLLLTLALPLGLADRGDGDHLVRVEVTAVAPVDEARAWLLEQGALIEVESHARLQVLVAPAVADALHDAREIVRVEPPDTPLPLQTAAAAMEEIGVDRWREAGFTGHGVHIAILDQGFSGYEGALGQTLPPPSRVTARSFRSDENISAGTDHGRRAAEIVHRVAPGAHLHLVNFRTLTELSAAVDHLIEQGVTAISFSLGYIHNGPGDGTGSVNEIVSRATNAGIAWIAASGNWAEQHWGGEFVDTVGDSLHEFQPGVNEVSHYFPEGDLIHISLRWDDPWGAACTDYDLELFGPDGSLVEAARTVQNCNGNPVEKIEVLATQSGEYHLRISRQGDGGDARRLSLVVVSEPDRGHPLSVHVPQGSLSQPADHPDVITVGAVQLSSNSEAAYSSRGPTMDGRVKPNVLAPTGLAGDGSQAFAGTSASAPHVAGVIALYQEAFPSADRGNFATLVQARGVPVNPIANGTPGARRIDTGTLTGVGATLPEGAAEAVALGNLPPPGQGGVSLLVYRGPDQYPLRFAHLLVDDRPVSGVFTFSTAQQVWLSYISGAPPWVNTMVELNDGDTIIYRLAEPGAP